MYGSILNMHHRYIPVVDVVDSGVVEVSVVPVVLEVESVEIVVEMVVP